MGNLMRKRLSACEVLRSPRRPANDVSCKSFEITLIISLVAAQQNSVSSRGWRSAPRDLTPAQALARYDRRALRLRRDGPLCDLISAGGPSVAAATSWMTRIHSC